MTKQGAAAHRRHRHVKHQQKLDLASKRSNAFCNLQKRSQHHRQQRRDLSEDIRSALPSVSRLTGRQRRNRLFSLNDEAETEQFRDFGQNLILEPERKKPEPKSYSEPSNSALLNELDKSFGNIRGLVEQSKKPDRKGLTSVGKDQLRSVNAPKTAEIRKAVTVDRFPSGYSTVSPGGTTFQSLPSPSIPVSSVHSFDRLLSQMTDSLSSKTLLAPQAGSNQEDQSETIIDSFVDSTFAKDADGLEKDPLLLSRRKWIEEGGDRVYRMDEETHDSSDETQQVHRRDSEKAVDSSETAVETLLQETDDWIQQSENASEEDTRRFLESLSRHWSAGVGPSQLLQLLQATLLDAFLNGLRPSFIPVWFVAQACFPLCDAWHPFISPLRLFLASQLSSPANSEKDWILQFFCASLLHQITRDSPNFVGELVNFLFKLLRLNKERILGESCEFPKSETLSLTRHLFPVLRTLGQSTRRRSATSEQLTTGTGVESSNVTATSNTESSIQLVSVIPLLKQSSLMLLQQLFQIHRHNPALPILTAQYLSHVEPALTTDLFLQQTRQSLHRVCLAAQNSSEPLALRTSRPKPLPQFDPLLQLTDDRNSRQRLKRDAKDEQKQIARMLTAESLEERRELEDAARVKRVAQADSYRTLMAELQEQQHMMKTVDAINDKKRKRTRRN